MKPNPKHTFKNRILNLGTHLLCHGLILRVLFAGVRDFRNVVAGFVQHSAEAANIAARSYRPDIYRRAVASLNIPLPGANSKVEGALIQPTAVGATGSGLVLGPDGFFDGKKFDPDSLDDYIRQQRSK